MKLVGSLAGGSGRLPLGLGLVLALEIERHGGPASSFTQLIFRFSLFLYGPALGGGRYAACPGRCSAVSLALFVIPKNYIWVPGTVILNQRVHEHE
jgi:hypothetical protein